MILTQWVAYVIVLIAVNCVAAWFGVRQGVRDGRK